MGILGWIILGLFAGAIAKGVHSGDAPGGLLGTLAVGVSGAVLGGFVAWAVGIGDIDGLFSVGTWIVALAGACLLLMIYSALVGGQSRPPYGAH
jgi:uncharacterized membrane protein YeaQ/YmgE (transglycosylase-associated protein family)